MATILSISMKDFFLNHGNYRPKKFIFQQPRLRLDANLIRLETSKAISFFRLHGSDLAMNVKISRNRW